MSRSFAAGKAAVLGAASQLGTGRFSAAGRPIVCPQCGGDVFQKREARLDTSAASAVGPGWLTSSPWRSSAGRAG